MSKVDQSLGRCRTEILGICIRTCDEDGNEVDTWINHNAISALAWCDGEVKQRPANPKGGPKKIPTVPKPKGCTQGKRARLDGPDAPLCWWDGQRWVCGQE